MWLLGPAQAAEGDAYTPSPHAIDIPKWFTESFLDFREDVREAAGEGKRLLVYFGQDGCPYCKALMKVNFGDPEIVTATRRRFVAVALNLWGDREVTWLDGRRMPEKELARLLGVQYTPTLLFLDEEGRVVLRMNGYQPPARFKVALQYAGRAAAQGPSFTEQLAGPAPRAAEKGGRIDLARMHASGKPLIALFVGPGCAECDELRREGLRRPEIKALLKRFDVAMLDLAGTRDVITPGGATVNEREWASSLRLSYTPALVFFEGGKEVFRVDGFVRPFHLATALEYVASGAYRAEPSFQRYLQKRADAIRASGGAVELWK